MKAKVQRWLTAGMAALVASGSGSVSFTSMPGSTGVVPCVSM